MFQGQKSGAEGLACLSRAQEVAVPGTTQIETTCSEKEKGKTKGRRVAVQRDSHLVSQNGKKSTKGHEELRWEGKVKKLPGAVSTEDREKRHSSKAGPEEVRTCASASACD